MSAASKCPIIGPRYLLRMILMNPLRKVPERIAGCCYVVQDLLNRILPLICPVPDYGDQAKYLRCMEQIVTIFERYSTEVNSAGVFA